MGYDELECEGIEIKKIGTMGCRTCVFRQRRVHREGWRVVSVEFDTEAASESVLGLLWPAMMAEGCRIRGNR